MQHIVENLVEVLAGEFCVSRTARKRVVKVNIKRQRLPGRARHDTESGTKLCGIQIKLWMAACA